MFYSSCLLWDLTQIDGRVEVGSDFGEIVVEREREMEEGEEDYCAQRKSI